MQSTVRVLATILRQQQEQETQPEPTSVDFNMQSRHTGDKVRFFIPPTAKESEELVQLST